MSDIQYSASTAHLPGLFTTLRRMPYSVSSFHLSLTERCDGQDIDRASICVDIDISSGDIAIIGWTFNLQQPLNISALVELVGFYIGTYFEYAERIILRKDPCVTVRLGNHQLSKADFVAGKEKVQIFPPISCIGPYRQVVIPRN